MFSRSEDALSRTRRIPYPDARERLLTAFPFPPVPCPRPLSSELLTSWLERVAVANLLSGSQLLDSLLRRCPELNKVCPCLDYDLPADWAKALGAFVGLSHIGFLICAGSSRVGP